MPSLQSLLDEAAAKRNVPGAAVAVGHADELLEAATGVLNRNTGVTTTPESIFQIGSVTKVLTAVLVLQLVDDGLVELDEPVRRYLPEFGVLDPVASEAVTVRHLLTHTGGFDGDLFEDTGRGDDALDRYLVHLRGHAQQISPPGERFSYNNAGYGVLGALVARLRGGTYESVLRSRLIEPLGAQHMALLAEEAVLYRVAAGHVGAEGKVATPWQLPRSLAPAGLTPCAAPRDLVRFGQSLLAGGLLSADSFAAMISPQLALPGVPDRGAGHRGLGPDLGDWDGTAVFGHDGSTVGQATVWRVVPAHRLVVAISANGGEASAFFDDLLGTIVHDLTGLTVPARPTPPAGPRTPGPSQYAGRYRYPMATYDVSVADDGFDVRWTPIGVAASWGESPKTYRFVALSGSTYLMREPEDGLHATLTFLDDGQYLYNSGRASRRVDSSD